MSPSSHSYGFTVRHLFSDTPGTIWLVAPLAVLSIVMGRMALDRNFALAAAGFVLLVFLASVAFRAPVGLLYAAIVWLVALGLIRRIVQFHGFLYKADPLLLIAPAIVALLWVVAVRRGAFSRLSALAMTVLILDVLFLASVVNPLQGGLMAGLGGLLFTLVPTLGFWIGRALVGTNVMSTILKLVAAVAVPVAIYGFYQVFVGFPSWDLAWISRVDYSALNVFGSNAIGATRPFGTLASAAEFVLLLAVGAVIFWSYLIAGSRRRFLLAAVMCLLLVGVVYGSARSVVFALVAAIGLTVAARRRMRPGIAAAVVAGLLVFLPFALAPLLPAVASSSPLIAHQVEGLADPLNPNRSTARFHASLVGEGLRSAISDPLGHGAGSVTLAAARFGSGLRTTEADPSNAAVALGVPGLLVFSALLVFAFRSMYYVATTRRDSVSLAALGLATVTALQWLNGGHYALTLLTWITLGCVDRMYAEISSKQGPRAQLPQP